MPQGIFNTFYIQINHYLAQYSYVSFHVFPLRLCIILVGDSVNLIRFVGEIGELNNLVKLVILVKLQNW